MGVVETVPMLIGEDSRRRVKHLRLWKEGGERWSALVTYEFERGFKKIVI